MRIGILCFWGVPNYGAWAQAYALNNVVRKILDDDNAVEHIAYLNPKHYDMYYANDERLHHSFAYSYNIIPHTRVMTAEELEREKFDIIITGSDAIWEFDMKIFGCDMHLIGNKLNCGRLVAYAPSFGTMNTDSEFPPFVKSGLDKYNNISVRDENSRDVVKQISGVDVPVVLDPTLLWDFKNDKNILNTEYKNYIAVYGTDWNDKFVQDVVSFAKENNLRTISLGYINNWCDVSLRLLERRGTEWIGMLKNADYVATSTFHGLMFGINFEKQIFFNQRDYVKKRSETLLSGLGIKSLYEHPENVISEVSNNRIDYKYVNDALKNMRNSSIDYLKNALFRKEMLYRAKE